MLFLEKVYELIEQGEKANVHICDADERLSLHMCDCFLEMDGDDLIFDQENSMGRISLVDSIVTFSEDILEKTMCVVNKDMRFFFDFAA